MNSTVSARSNVPDPVTRSDSSARASLSSSVIGRGEVVGGGGATRWRASADSGRTPLISRAKEILVADLFATGGGGGGGGGGAAGASGRRFS